MKLHTLFQGPRPQRASIHPQSPSLQRGSALAVLACAALSLWGCGGSEDAADASAQADELVSVQPAAEPIPADVADQLIAEELAGTPSSVPPESTVKAEKTGAEAMGLATAQKAYCLPAIVNPVYRWNELALEAVRSASMSDVQAARVYAMVNVAMYDAINGIEIRRGVMRAQALVSAQGAPRDASLLAAASAAARVVLTSLRPDLAQVYTAQHNADLNALRHHEPKRLGATWGTTVGNQVVVLRTNDGSAMNEIQSANNAVGQFRASWSGVQFRNLKPFAIATAAAYVQPGPPALNTIAYAAAFNDVKREGNGAVNNPRLLMIYNFWASKAGTSQPAGEWVKVAMSLVRKKNLSVQESARLMALMGMGLSDVVAPTLTTKFFFRHWRPVTAVREASTSFNAATAPDPDWTPRGGLPGGTSPEYVSGHSSFAAAGGTILRNFFCDDAIRFTLQTDVPAGASPANPVRSFDAFSEAAFESGRSRVMGGLHFEFSNQDGVRLGQGVALEVLKRSLLRTQGETHRLGTCPR